MQLELFLKILRKAQSDMPWFFNGVNIATDLLKRAGWVSIQQNANITQSTNVKGRYGLVACRNSRSMSLDASFAPKESSKQTVYNNRTRVYCKFTMRKTIKASSADLRKKIDRLPNVQKVIISVVKSQLLARTCSTKALKQGANHWRRRRIWTCAEWTPEQSAGSYSRIPTAQSV